ncbi:hypothetical protein CJU94_35540 (plasmid) [Paraburkholderia aromaticivorans]|uniref:Uncharacterized protein n=1 Tax=Paraburkholderia aromaticivorans TaxID=2026199 RepID=A0A248VX75_9BURK|nr:hypothetical protein CJU94_35540 [Paraburkholderia aromaticivorans]
MLIFFVLAVTSKPIFFSAGSASSNFHILQNACEAADAVSIAQEASLSAVLAGVPTSDVERQGARAVGSGRSDPAVVALSPAN